jgi:phosphatidylserine decarboxylase
LVKTQLQGNISAPGATTVRHGKGDDFDSGATIVESDKEFAIVNGISYTLSSLLSDKLSTQKPSQTTDASLPTSTKSTLDVASEVVRSSITSWLTSTPQKRLFFCVVYLAPGDYHRFHSPVSWIVERRRHFSGELYSVSPYLQSRLQNLFVLNERVVLLGRWKYGMSSLTAVGATNVGSIKIHFDRELRTNSLTHDATTAGLHGGFAEATYKGASALLGGQPIRKGEEMGGFNLGSTVVLVFEAPATSANGESGQCGLRFCIERGQYVKVGQAIAIVEKTLL